MSVVSDDPMLQQIQIITGYIAQARQANRYAELLRDYIKELKFLAVDQYTIHVFEIL